ncbi:MAG: EF-hand domain-containing protein [Planctomycetota bacterium]|nr:MAG: EF-hand domain-containing protein [Planctomycetota bacterium]
MIAKRLVVSAVVAGYAATVSAQTFDCGFRESGSWLDDAPDRVLPELPAPATVGSPSQCLTVEQIFLYEDTDQVLLTNFSSAQLLTLMSDAANSLLATWGDNYDFIGYWLSFAPDHTIGSAFYNQVSNDVTGIGDVGEPVGLPTIFDRHAALGLAGEKIQGRIMMWDIASWQPGNGPAAEFTRMALGQEFHHRFAMFLPPLPDGRLMQGITADCGRQYHWNWRVDGQGSCMEISEWVGTGPAELTGNFVTFNTDIPGSIFSYTDLYLMGYVSPAEMDAGNSELRYMNTSTCTPFYSDTISSFSSADIIASAGPRVPDHTAAQKDFKTAWIMFHLPARPPTFVQLSKTVDILEQHMDDWSLSTLGRGTMDNALFTDVNCNGVPDSKECLADLDDSGAVGIEDFLALLKAWGDPGGPADLDGDGTVGITDFLLLLAAWGPCP